MEVQMASKAGMQVALNDEVEFCFKEVFGWLKLKVNERKKKDIYDVTCLVSFLSYRSAEGRLC